MSHWFKYAGEHVVCYTVLERYVDSVSTAFPPPFIILRTRPRKIFAEFVETASHHAIGGVEGLFDTVAVVAVDVDV